MQFELILKYWARYVQILELLIPLTWNHMAKIPQAMTLQIQQDGLKEKIKNKKKSFLRITIPCWKLAHMKPAPSSNHQASTNAAHDVLTWVGRHTGTGKASIVAHFEVRVDGVVIG